MSDINIVVPKVYEFQLGDPEVKKEIDSVQEYIQKVNFVSQNSIEVVVLRGKYDSFERKMNTAIVFVNNLLQDIKELHCELRISSKNSNVKFAKATVDFDYAFMGRIRPREGMLVHLNIPVKGLDEDHVYTNKELIYEVEGVRVTYAEEKNHI